MDLFYMVDMAVLKTQKSKDQAFKASQKSDAKRLIQKLAKDDYYRHQPFDNQAWGREACAHDTIIERESVTGRTPTVRPIDFVPDLPFLSMF